MTRDALKGPEREMWVTADKAESNLKQQLEPKKELEPFRKYTEEILRKVAPAFLSDGANMQPRVYIIPATTANAFVLPNGAMYIHTGLLSLMENEAQLATVLAHEFGHFTHRHGYLEKKQHSLSEILAGAVAVSAAVAAGSSGYSPEIGLDAGQLVSLSATSFYSKSKELQADHIGLVATLEAGYEPNEMPRVFELLLNSPDTDTRQTMFSSHPSLKKRVKSYRQSLSSQEMQSHIKGRFAGQQQYNEHVLPALLVNAQLHLRRYNETLAKRDVERCLAIDPNCANAYYWHAKTVQQTNTKDRHWQAIEKYHQALLLDPNHALARRDLGLAYRWVRGHKEESRRHLEAYSSLDASDVAAPIIQSILSNSLVGSDLEQCPEHFNSDPNSQALGDAHDNLKAAQFVGVLPTALAIDVNDPQAKANVVSQEIESYLGGRGVHVVSASCFSSLLKTMTELAENSEGEKRELTPAERIAVYRLAREEYLLRYPVDVLVSPSITPVTAEWKIFTAKWHGVSQGVYSNAVMPVMEILGGSAKEGWISACSLRLSVLSPTGKTEGSSYGGIQLLSRYTGFDFKKVAKEKLLADEEKLRKSVAIALGTVFDEEDAEESKTASRSGRRKRPVGGAI